MVWATQTLKRDRGLQFSDGPPFVAVLWLECNAILPNDITILTKSHFEHSVRESFLISPPPSPPIGGSACWLSIDGPMFM